MPFFGVPIRNGLPIGLGSVAGFGVQQFDPLELFAGGANGVWYDPSDTSTLFQDPTGTTPVTAVEQPVGLMLDKSKGLVLGSELSVPSGTVFRDGVNPTVVFNTGATVTAGRMYLITYTVANAGSTVSSSWRINNIGGLINTPTVAANFSGTVTGIFLASGSGSLSLNPDFSTVNLSISNASVRELPGNHAISYNSTTARPTLSARVNLLTYSEEFDNAAWTKVLMNTTGTPPWVNVAVAPDGTTTADKLIPSAGAGLPYAQETITTVSGVVYTWSVYLKASGYSWVFLDAFDGTNHRTWFDLSTGVVGTVEAGNTSTITDVGNGWYRCTLTRSAGSTSIAYAVAIVSGNNALNITANGTDGVLAWGAQLIATNAFSANTYQRIAAATDYDTNGFPKYLYFAGTDDGMSTPANLNLTSTDKVTVFSGVRKLSDAAASVLTELSALIASNNGVFAILGPSSAAGNNLRFVSKGTIVAESNAAAVSPISGVITGVGDISGDVCQFRFNGSVTQTTTTDQGTGNYGSYPLYIGSRNNASAWFNGYLYGLTVVGAQLTAPQIESMETWTAQRTGITL